MDEMYLEGWMDSIEDRVRELEALVLCPQCYGRAVVRGEGGLLRDCDTCSGTGRASKNKKRYT